MEERGRENNQDQAIEVLSLSFYAKRKKGQKGEDGKKSKRVNCCRERGGRDFVPSLNE